MPTGSLSRMPPARRRQLVTAAVEEFAAAGFERASLNRIIAACGLSKSSFYYVVASKQELFDIVVRELAAGLGAAIDVPPPSDFTGDQFWPTARRLLERLAAAGHRDGSYLALGRMFYLSGSAEQAAVTDTVAAVDTWLGQVLAAGRAGGAVRDDLPVSLQHRLVVAVLRALDDWSVHHAGTLPATDLDAALAAQFATLHRLLAPDAWRRHQEPVG